MHDAKPGATQKILPAFRAAFPLTLPVLAGFLFLGIAYGVLMRGAGAHVGWIFFTSYMVFAGSMQYLAIGFLAMPFDPLYAFVLTLMVNARHIFYGLSILDKLAAAKRFRPYIVLMLCDETFSILSSNDAPEGVDTGWFMFIVALLNRWYWILGSVLGGVLGDILPFDTRGLDFALTALFTVIFAENWLDRKNRPSAAIGVATSFICLLIFGSNFIIPAMILMLIVFALVPRRFTGEEALS